MLEAAGRRPRIRVGGRHEGPNSKPAAFHADQRVEFRLYDKLNHLGIAGEGDGSLAEYNTPGHVDAQLVADVAAWVKAH